MADKILDCSKLSDKAFEAVQNGLDLHVLSRTMGKKSVFGCVVKEDMKYLTKRFRYTDKGTLIKGGIIGAGAVWVGSKIKKGWDKYKDKIVQVFSSEEEKEEESE